MKKVIATFLLTSIFWILLFLVFTAPEQEPATVPAETELAGTPAPAAEPAAPDAPAATTPTAAKKPRKPAAESRPELRSETKQPKQAVPQPPRPDYTQEIIGRWQPVEGAKNPLEFTAYGTFIQWIYPTIDERDKYSVSNDRVTFGRNGTGTIVILHDDTGTYLEIRNSTEYSGRYRLTKKPRPLKPSSILEPNDYPTAIIGKWKPVDGAKCPLEFSKYGTVIQWIYPTIDERHEYSIENDRVRIGNGTARAVITPTASGTYLELYDNTEYSGRYKKAD